MVQALGQGPGKARPGERLLVSAGHSGESRGRAGLHELPEATSPPGGGGNTAVEPSGDYDYTGLVIEIGVEECVGVKGV